jgi:HK97 family phage major capsid protein
MNPNELYERARGLIRQAQEILDDPRDDQSLAQVDRLLDEADRLKRLADQGAALKSAPGAIRLPFEVGSLGLKADATQDDAIKAVVAEVYGQDYQARLTLQRRAFNKALRYGFDKLSGAERATLAGQVLLRPEQIERMLQGGMDAAAIKDLTLGVDVSGGFMAPEDFRAEVIRALPGLTVVRSRARVVPTNRDTLVVPVVSGDDDTYSSAVRVSWVTEGSEPDSDSEPSFGQERIPIYTALAKTQIGNDLLEDAGTDIAALLAELYAEAYALDEDEQFLVGDGAGKPQGILPGGENANSIAEVKSGNASTLTADGLIDLLYDLPVQYHANAAFVMNSATAAAVRKLKDQNDQYLWQLGLAAGQPDTLLGKPLAVSEFMPNVAADAYPVLLGDFGRGYWIADRVGLSVQRLVEKYAESNMTGFVARRRVGGQMVLPNAFRVQKVAS